MNQNDTVSVRYMVDDVVTAVDFYCSKLGFTVGFNAGPNFASVRRDHLELWLAGRGSSAGRAMPDGISPAPGGWNRFVIKVDNIEEMVTGLREAGVGFRNEIIRGPGGAQVLVLDPSGNVVEIFQPAA
jgi:catechol 2,3-dioxygenase-like lactoylglutathione lyase family enzyme